MKCQGGFSFAEVILSVMIFMILAGAALPLISGAARNLAFAQESYEAHLAVGRLLQSTRGSIISGGDIRTAAGSLNLDVYAYSIWVVDGNRQTAFHSENAPVEPELTNIVTGHSQLDTTGGLHIIIVVVWGEGGSLLGRTVGTVSI